MYKSLYLYRIFYVTIYFMPAINFIYPVGLKTPNQELVWLYLYRIFYITIDFMSLINMII